FRLGETFMVSRVRVATPPCVPRVPHSRASCTPRSPSGCGGGPPNLRRAPCSVRSSSRRRRGLGSTRSTGTDSRESLSRRNHSLPSWRHHVREWHRGACSYRSTALPSFIRFPHSSRVGGRSGAPQRSLRFERLFRPGSHGRGRAFFRG